MARFYRIEIFRVGPNSHPGIAEEAITHASNSLEEAKEKTKAILRDKLRPTGPDGARLINDRGEVVFEWGAGDSLTG